MIQIVNKIRSKICFPLLIRSLLYFLCCALSLLICKSSQNICSANMCSLCLYYTFRTFVCQHFIRIFVRKIRSIVCVSFSLSELIIRDLLSYKKHTFFQTKRGLGKDFSYPRPLYVHSTDSVLFLS